MKQQHNHRLPVRTATAILIDIRMRMTRHAGKFQECATFLEISKKDAGVEASEGRLVN